MGSYHRRHFRALSRARGLLHRVGRAPPGRRHSGSSASVVRPLPATHLERDSHAVGEGCDRAGFRPPWSESLSSVHYSQALGEVEDDPQYEEDQSSYRSHALPHGAFSHDPSVDRSGGLGGISRSQRCVLPCAYSPSFEGSSGVFLSGRNLQVQGPPVRFETGSSGVYPSGFGAHGVSSEAGAKAFRLLGRLAFGGQFQASPSGAFGSASAGHAGTRVPGELGKVRIVARPQFGLSRGGAGLSESVGPSQWGQGSVDYHGSPVSAAFPQSSGQAVAPVAGLFGQPGRCVSGCSSAHEAFSKASSAVLQAECRFPFGQDSFAEGDQASVGPLGGQSLFGSGQAFSRASSFDFPDDGRLPPGVGGSLFGQHGVGDLGFSRPSAHQCVGNDGGVRVASSFQTAVSWSHGSVADGQHNCGCLHQSSGRHQVVQPERVSCSAVAVVSGGGNHSSSVLYSWPGQSGGRFPVQREVSPIGVGSPFGGLRSSPVGLVSFGDRPIRIPLQPPPSKVLFSGPGSGGLGVGCLLDPLGVSSELCVSPVRLDSSGLEENQGGRGVGSVDRPSLAEEVLVSGPPGIVGGETALSSAEGGFGGSASFRDSSSSASGPPFDRLAVIGEVARAEGLSERASQFLVKSRRDSTRAVYNSRLEAFHQWCEVLGVVPRLASVGVIADFLISLFDKGRSLSTLRGYRSAIAAIHAGFPDGSGVSNSPRLAMLLRSFFLERPPQQKLAPPWSLPKVLAALAKPPFEPLAKASLHCLTIKTLFLIAIASGQRRGTLHALCVSPGHIRWERKGVRLIPRPSFIAKNQTVSSGPVEIFLCPLSSVSSVEEDKVWCPVRALKWYLDRTKGCRTGEQLFLITREPFSPASKESISRWLVEAVQAAGPEALAEGVRPRAHDTRGVSTSWALFHGVALQDIMKAAFWSSPNSFISCYLKDVPASEERFATASLLAASSSLVPR